MGKEDRAVGDPVGLRLGDWLTMSAWVHIFAIWSAVLILSYAAEAAARLTSGGGVPSIGPEFLWGPFVDAALWTLTTAAVFPLTRWFPLEHGIIVRNGAVLMLAGLILVPSRNVLMAWIASALGALRSDFDFGYLFFVNVNQDLFVYWLMVLAIHAVRHSRAIQERETARAQVEVQLAQAQLQMLKVQIQPHFLFNTLNAIATLVRGDPARAERMVEHLSEMLRIALTHSATQEVMIRDELATLLPYLEIEKVRFGDRLSVQIEVDEALQNAVVPHLLLQPLVENAIRHGISPRRRAGWVRVAVSAESDRLHLTVEDNGVGMSGAIRPGAIGLENTRSRLAQLYGNDQCFEIISAPEEGTRINIALPLRRTESSALLAAAR